MSWASLAPSHGCCRAAPCWAGTTSPSAKSGGVGNPPNPLLGSGWSLTLLQEKPGLSPSWAAHEVRSHPAFLRDWCISMSITGKTQETVGFLGQLQEIGLGPATLRGGHARCTKQALPSTVSLGSGHTHTHRPNARCSLQRWEGSETLPRKAIPLFCSSSGSLGFSEACPQPAHTAWHKRRSSESRYLPVLASSHRPQRRARLLRTEGHHCVSECPFFPTRFPWQRRKRPASGCYLDWDPFGNVHDQLHVGIVVVVGPPGDGHVVICHFDVL